MTDELKSRTTFLNGCLTDMEPESMSFRNVWNSISKELKTEPISKNLKPLFKNKYKRFENYQKNKYANECIYKLILQNKYYHM